MTVRKSAATLWTQDQRMEDSSLNKMSQLAHGKDTGMEIREDNGKNQGIHSEGPNITILRVAKEEKMQGNFLNRET